jgi:hypothetical protein
MARACIMFIDRIASDVLPRTEPLGRCDLVSPHEFADSLRGSIHSEQILGMEYF